MSLGPPTAANHNRNLIANTHLVAHVGNLKVKTATGVRAHRFVKRDTTDKEIQVTTTGDVPLGIVTHRIIDDDIATAADYAAADVLKVERGAGTCRKVVLLSGSAAVVPGDELTTATGGKLKKRSALSATTPAGATAVTSSGAQPAMTMAGGTLPEPLVAYAAESCNPAAADTECAAFLAL